MTSLRQIEANRRNANRSTGPTTEDGKLRSRRNAVRHGLSAETVVEIVEDIDDYKGFEAAIIADYDARTAVERELVLRLAATNDNSWPPAGSYCRHDPHETTQTVDPARELTLCFQRLANRDNGVLDRLGR